MTDLQQRQVLFADLRGSTALYESVGSARAAGWVTQAIAKVALCVSDQRGTVVKTLGDGLMATFRTAERAVGAAMQMQEIINQIPVDPPGGRTSHSAPRLHLQISLASGEVVEVGGDCFGDAVNVAARLLDHAGDSEMLITRELYEQLPTDLRGSFQTLDKMHLRGRSEPVEVLVARSHSDSLLTHLGSRWLESPSTALGITLRWRGSTLSRPCALMPLVIGRGRGSHVLVEDSRVSRNHVRIDNVGGSLHLRDLSINGTFVRFVGDDEVVSLRRSNCTLHGHGEIGLGNPPGQPRVPTILFSVITDSAIWQSVR